MHTMLYVARVRLRQLILLLMTLLQMLGTGIQMMPLMLLLLMMMIYGLMMVMMPMVRPVVKPSPGMMTQLSVTIVGLPMTLVLTVMRKMDLVILDMLLILYGSLLRLPTPLVLGMIIISVVLV